MALGVSLTVLAAGAETIKVSADSTYGQDIEATDNTISIENNGKIINNKIILEGGSFKNTGLIQTKTLELKVNSSDTKLAGTIVADDFKFYGAGNTTYQSFTGEAIIANSLSIISSASGRAGLRVTKSSQLAGVGEVYIESNGQRSS